MIDCAWVTQCSSTDLEKITFPNDSGSVAAWEIESEVWVGAGNEELEVDAIGLQGKVKAGTSTPPVETSTSFMLV